MRPSSAGPLRGGSGFMAQNQAGESVTCQAEHERRDRDFQLVLRQKRQGFLPIADG